MKRRTGLILIGIWMGAFLFSASPSKAEKEKVVEPVRPVQSERSFDRSPAAGSENPEDGIGLDDVLQFKAGGDETPLPEREAEALRFHQNATLERFENADAHGELVLSFSDDGVELRLRSITGSEAPAAGESRSPKE